MWALTVPWASLSLEVEESDAQHEKRRRLIVCVKQRSHFPQQDRISSR